MGERAFWEGCWQSSVSGGPPARPSASAPHGVPLCPRMVRGDYFLDVLARRVSAASALRALLGTVRPPLS